MHDRSPTAHWHQTTLTPGQEQIVVHLRCTLLLSLDGLLAVTREIICSEGCRSQLDRCLRRHGLGNFNALRPTVDDTSYKTFKACEPGYLHVDVKDLQQMPDQTKRTNLFVAIDRAMR